MRNRIFGNIAALSRWGSFFAPLSNWTLKSAWFKDLLENHAGIDRRADPTRFYKPDILSVVQGPGGLPASAALRGQVLLFPDTFTNYNHPNLGVAATKVLERLGYQVVLPHVKCCGRPMLSKGMLDTARRNARFNVDSLYPLRTAGRQAGGPGA